MYKSYEDAQAEVDKLRQEFYPNLFTVSDDASSKLDTIAEDMTDLTDTNNENTEDTSDAPGSGSDDAVRRGTDEGEESATRSDEENDEDGDGEDENENENVSLTKCLSRHSLPLNARTAVNSITDI